MKADELTRQILGWVYPGQVRAARSISLMKPSIDLGSSAHGRHTILDEMLRHRDVVPTDFVFEIYPSMTISKLNELFSRYLITSSVTQSGSFPLSSISGVSATRENLFEHSSVSAFGKHCLKWNDFLEQAEDKKEASRLLLNEALLDGGERFDLKLWAPAIRFQNSDGSHRLSSVVRMNEEYNFNFHVRGQIKVHGINYGLLRQLSEVFDIYVTAVLEWDQMYTLQNFLNGGEYRDWVYLVVSLPKADTGCPDSLNQPALTFLLKKNERSPLLSRAWLKEQVRLGRVQTYDSFLSVLREREQEGRDFVSRIVKES